MNRFEECRRAKGYSQKYVAIALGVKPPQISKWENETQRPSRDNCVKMAELFGVSVDYLLGLSDDPNPTAPQELDTEAWAIRERLRRDPAYRLLFDAADNATPEHLRAAVAVLQALDPNEGNEDNEPL